MSNRPMRYVALIATMTLEGCGVEQDLSTCVRETEPTVLLRQMTMSGRLKDNFDNCLKTVGWSLDDCRVLWLDRDGIVKGCMKDRGYTYLYGYTIGSITCGMSEYKTTSCYKYTTQITIERVLDNLSSDRK